MPSNQGHLTTQSPIIFDATAESMLKDAEGLINCTKKAWDHIVASIQPESATWGNTIIPIIADENNRSKSERTLRFYASTSPSKELRDASNMFRLVDSVAQCPSSDLDDESSSYLQKLRRKFDENGCGLTDSSIKSHFETCRKHLLEIERECNRNFHEEKTGLWLTLDDLNGVPERLLERFNKGKGEHDSHFWVPTKEGCKQVMLYAHLETTRKKVFYAIQNRMPSNVPLFRELVLLRDETARLLGYPNHAAFKTANKMVKTPDTVNRLLAEIRAHLVPWGSKFAADLLELKKANASALGHTADNIFFWDEFYFERLLRETKTSPITEVSEYFELYTTLSKLLQMFEHLFDTRFERITLEQQTEIGSGRPLIWHEDVLMYTVWDNRKLEDSFMGYAYFDLHPRKGKYTHSGHYLLQPMEHDFRPSSALVMNYSKTPNRPTLLSMSRVCSLFHEIGHLIHALYTKTKYAVSHYVDRDFIEAPSWMFEQFFWQAHHIQQVSFHYSHISPTYENIWRVNLVDDKEEATRDLPSAQLEDHVVAAMIEFDLCRGDVGPSRAELQDMNLAELFNKTKSETWSLSGGEAVGEGWEYAHGETVFRNVISGYDAGYYSYVLGKVFALDIFKTGFEEDTMSKEAGKRFRDVVLQFGGSQPEMKTLTDYLGRQPSTRPYFEYLGITTGDDEYQLS